jgi:hypothetical protein
MDGFDGGLAAEKGLEVVEKGPNSARIPWTAS